MKKKLFNITVTTINTTDDYFAVAYKQAKDGIVIFKGNCTIVYPTNNIVRIVIRNA